MAHCHHGNVTMYRTLIDPTVAALKLAALGFLVVLLTCTHGAMSASIPHHGSETHQHLSAVHHDHVEGAKPATAADDDTHCEESDAATDHDASHGVGYHTHLAVGLATSAGIPPQSLRAVERQSLPTDDPFRRSRRIAPLPEPPTA